MVQHKIDHVLGLHFSGLDSLQGEFKGIREIFDSIRVGCSGSRYHLSCGVPKVADIRLGAILFGRAASDSHRSSQNGDRVPDCHELDPRRRSSAPSVQTRGRQVRHRLTLRPPPEPDQAGKTVCKCLFFKCFRGFELVQVVSKCAAAHPLRPLPRGGRGRIRSALPGGTRPLAPCDCPLARFGIIRNVGCCRTEFVRVPVSRGRDAFDGVPRFGLEGGAPLSPGSSARHQRKSQNENCCLGLRVGERCGCPAPLRLVPAPIAPVSASAWRTGYPHRSPTRRRPIENQQTQCSIRGRNRPLSQCADRVVGNSGKLISSSRWIPQ